MRAWEASPERTHRWIVRYLSEATLVGYLCARYLPSFFSSHKPHTGINNWSKTRKGYMSWTWDKEVVRWMIYVENDGGKPNLSHFKQVAANAEPFSTMLGGFYLGCAGVLTEKNCLIYTNVLTQAFLPGISISGRGGRLALSHSGLCLCAEMPCIWDQVPDACAGHDFHQHDVSALIALIIWWHGVHCCTRRQHAIHSWPLVRPVFPYRLLIKKARFSTWLLSLLATTISGAIKFREQALGVVQKDVQSRSHRASTIFPTYPKAFRRWWLRCCYNWRFFVGRWGSFFPLHINPSRSASDILRCPISGPYHVLFIQSLSWDHRNARQWATRYRVDETGHVWVETISDNQPLLTYYQSVVLHDHCVWL